MRLCGVVFCCLAAWLGLASCGDDDPDPCDGIDCSGHGSCAADDMSPYCDCDDGYVALGLFCVSETAVDPCERADCPGHTTCVPEGVVARCECRPGCADGGCGPNSRAVICSGSFLMGSPDQEAPLRTDTDGDEQLHEVHLANDFELLANEVTQQGFAAVMGFNPSSRNACPECPVEHVTWSQAAAFCNALSDEDGLDRCYECEPVTGDYRLCWFNEFFDTPYDCPGYRLPTEAEWEYAARAGTETPTYAVADGDPFGFAPDSACLDDPWLGPIAWYCGNADERTQQVQRKLANGFGLFDMLGNVNEWCHDFYDDGYDPEPVVNPFGPRERPDDQHVFRGGGFYNSRRLTRAAARFSSGYDTNVEDLGFRVARTLSLEPE